MTDEGRRQCHRAAVSGARLIRAQTALPLFASVLSVPANEPSAASRRAGRWRQSGVPSSRVTSGPVDAGVGVLAGGADYLADAAAICVSLPAIRLSHRSPTTGRPLGHPNATKVAALVNGGWLLVLSILVAPSAALRLVIAVIVGYALALVREVVAALRG